MIYFLSILGAVVVGILAKFISDSASTPLQITRNELMIGIAVVALIAVPATVKIGSEVAKGNNLEFNEYWNGYELEAVERKIICKRDGSCQHDYSCDPYQVPVTTTSTDANGNITTSTTYITQYHSCPYVTEERAFYIKTSFDTHKIGDNRMADGAKAFRNKGIPSYIQSGKPKQWVEARARLDKGIHGPATARMKYENYILASQDTILKDSSDAIDKYKKAKLMPKPAKDIHHFYLADKVHFVGLKPTNEESWQHHQMTLNAALGSDLQGDMQTVVFDLNDIDDPDEYTQAIYAHWQSKAFEKDAISKNAIILFLGTSDEKTVEWAHAVTGMPGGNGPMLQQLRNELRGLTLDPATLYGYPQPVIKSGKVKNVRDTESGAVSRILWGPNKFERVCMTCEDKSDEGTGFTYLDAQIELTGIQKLIIFFVSLLTSGIVWAILFAVGRERHGHNYYNW